MLEQEINEFGRRLGLPGLELSALDLTRAYSNADNEAHSKRFHPRARRG